mmetsp:Transcript_3251/g.8651  ORF Transcript_3251/g.8651 Transcript_3251/m.8651 type:complete len:88 (-) Transcript_3251:514-777(-)
MGLVELGIGAYACAQVGHSGGWQVSDAGAIGPAAFGLSKALKGLQRLWHLLLGFMMQVLRVCMYMRVRQVGHKLGMCYKVVVQAFVG